MKKNKSLFIMGAALLLLAGCTVDEFSEHDGQIPVRLSVSQEATVTRAADGLYTASTGFSGSENVEVYVNSSDKHATFTVGTPDATTHQSSLTGTLYYPTTGDANLYAVYPSTSTSSHTVKYDQTTDANYKLSDLMYAKKTVKQANKASTQNLEFGHQLVKLKVIIKKAADVSQVTLVKMKNVKRTVSVAPDTLSITVGTATETLSGNADYYSSDNNSILIAGSQTSSTSAQTYTFACVFPAQAWSNTDFIEVTADGKTLACKLARSEWTPGAEYTLTINVNAAALGTSVSITNWNNSNPDAIVNPTVEVPLPDRTPSGVVAVDLGLPSGLKWANMNIGATSVTDYGLYFAWGGTVGRSGENTGGTANDNYSYNWANAPYNNGNSSLVSTKYNDTDCKTKLEFCDDAAYAAWGGAWRMPTKAECEELKKYCNWTWEDGSGSSGLLTGGIKGYKVAKTSDASVYIFLPAAGIREDTEVKDQSEKGRYWSSTVMSNYAYPHTIVFDSDYIGAGGVGWTRREGLAVRAVQ